MKQAATLAPLLALLAGCAAQSSSVVALPRMEPEPLYRPAEVKPGRLEYAPDRSTFAPILTERFPYPTQPQANDAYLRLIAAGPPGVTYPESIWLFGCKPGELDEQTAQVARHRGAIVHCATDFLDASGHRLRRETANFSYDGKLWSMRPVNPPKTDVPWRNREHSPKDFWWWVPWRPRYE
jgi:hypothetical protein